MKNTGRRSQQQHQTTTMSDRSIFGRMILGTPRMSVLLIVATSLLVLFAQVWKLVKDRYVWQSFWCEYHHWIVNSLPLHPHLTEWMVWLHESTGSYMWMRLSTVLMWLWDISIGTELYVFMALTHIVKNYAKNLIACPRGMWFCSSGEVPFPTNYCEKGFALPSGHSMMSIAFFLYINYKSGWNPRLLIVSLLTMAFIVFEILYLYIHTIVDVLFGYAFGAICFLFYVIWDQNKSKQNTKAPSFSFTTGHVIDIVLSVSMMVLMHELEVIELKSSLNFEFPHSWQETVVKRCLVAKENAPGMMAQSYAFEKTALLAGFVASLLLRKALSIDQYVTNSTTVESYWKHLLRFGCVAVGTYIPVATKHFALYFFGYFEGRYFVQLPNLLTPVWILVVTPMILGHRERPQTYTKKRKDQKVD